MTPSQSAALLLLVHLNTTVEFFRVTIKKDCFVCFSLGFLAVKHTF